MTPVLFLFFNRPETTARVFATIRSAKPEKLYLAADGPRAGRSEEAELCRKTRATVEEMIDWPCEVHRLYREENLGCRLAVSSAIDWFFSHVEEGIILEDDALPSPSFFEFAETMLKRYRVDSRVMHISGNNHQHGRIRGDGAYYASRFAHSWGWATWRRSWNLYDREMSGFPGNWDEIASRCNLPSRIKVWWNMVLKNTREGVVNTWDFQWHYTVMKHQGVCLIPNRNLVENIGVGEAATHMKQRDVASSITIGKLRYFTRPSDLEICREADLFDFDHAVTNQKLPWRSPAEVLRSWQFQRR
jgi:hypothetical protein